MLQVPEALLELAMQSSWFRKSRFKSGKGKAIVGGAGLGYKERPGFGASAPSSSSGSHSNNFSSNDSAKSTNDTTSSSSTSNRFTAMRETFKNQYQSQVRIRTRQCNFD